MRHRSSSWLGLAAGVTVLGLVIGPAREARPRDLDSATFRRPAAAIVARTAAAISAATAGRPADDVTTPQGVSRVIIDAPGQATELVRNRAGGTLSESGIRRVPGPARKYESRTVDFDLGTWSQAVLSDAPASPGRGSASIENPAEAIAAQLHHPFAAAGPARSTRVRVIGSTSIDGAGVRARVQWSRRAAGQGLDQPLQLAPGPVGQPGRERGLPVDGAGRHPRGQPVALGPSRPGPGPGGVNGRACVRRGPRWS